MFQVLHNTLPSPQTPKLLDQARAVLRVKHYSPRTEEPYTQWIVRFIFFHQKRHPREMRERSKRVSLTFGGKG
ncbi:MAG: phage integrase N-terminal SAM-like domain-containing protein [candidate division KSB1 bacterium]